MSPIPKYRASRLGLFCAAVSLTVTGALIGSDRLQRFAKPMIVPSLALGSNPRLNEVLLAGLAAATVGDVLLLDPDDDAKLIRGATAFAVMQACYSVLLVDRGARPTATAAAPRLAGWAVAAVALWLRARAVAPVLAGYGLTLAITSTLSADPALAPGFKTVAGLPIPTCDRRTWLGVGGALFTVSDALIVGRRLFVRGNKSRRIFEGVILSTYAAAQVMLVNGLWVIRQSPSSISAHTTAASDCRLLE